MFVANTHDDLEHPPNVPLITGSVQRQTRKESLTDAFTNAASAIAKALSPPTTSSSTCSPSKVVDIRMKNLEQLREDGVLYRGRVSPTNGHCYQVTQQAGLI